MVKENLTLTKEFRIKFEMLVTTFPTKLSNVLDMKVGNNSDIAPSVLVLKNIAQVCFALGPRKSWCSENIKIEQNTWTRFKISQKKKRNTSYYFQIMVNNTVHRTAINSRPKEFIDVKVWTMPFDGELRNLIACTEGKCLIIKHLDLFK